MSVHHDTRLRRRGGPFPAGNRFLLHASFLNLAPRSARVLHEDQWRVNVQTSVANTYAKSAPLSYWLKRTSYTDPLDRIRYSATGPIYFADGELRQSVLSLRRGLPFSTEVEIALSFAEIDGGSSDGTIESIHDTFELGSDGRDLLQRDKSIVYMRTRDDRELLVTGTSRSTSATLSLTKALLTRGPHALSARASVKVPLRSPRFASPGTDAAIELLWTSDAAVGTMSVAASAVRYDEDARLDTEAMTAFDWNASFIRSIGTRWSVGIQVLATQSPLQTFPELRRRSYQLATGAQRKLRTGALLYAALIENVQSYENGADAGIEIGVILSFHSVRKGDDARQVRDR